VGRYQKGKTKLDFAEARDSEWQWHQLGHMMQVCTLFQTDNHTSTSVTTQFFTGRMPFLPPNQQRQSTEGNADSYTQMHVSLGRNREKKPLNQSRCHLRHGPDGSMQGKGNFGGISQPIVNYRRYIKRVAKIINLIWLAEQRCGFLM